MGIEAKLKSKEITSNSCGNGSQEKRFCMALLLKSVFSVRGI